MGEPIIREMQEHEAQDVLRGQKKSFSPLFALFLSRPEAGMVAEVEGKIVGAATYKLIATKKGKVGYLDIGYVDASQRGKRLGSRLYVAAMDKMRELGCETITATVRDDNRASWKILENQGCVVAPFYKLIGRFGLLGALRIAANAHLSYAIGHELWATGTATPQSTAKNLLTYFIINMLLFLLASRVLIAARGDMYFTLGALVVLGFTVFGGWLGTRGTSAKWYFQRPHAALPLSLFISLIYGLLPIIGAWQLKEEASTTTAGQGTAKVANTTHASNTANTAKDRNRLLSRSSLGAWWSLIVVTLGSLLSLKYGSFTEQTVTVLSGAVNLGFMLLVYRCIPVFPFESFGGRRVYDWKPALFWIMALISAGLVATIIIW